MTKQISITREQNKILRGMIESDCSAHKNWIASAVESGDFAYAQKLTVQLRERQAMFHIIVPDGMF